MWTNLILLHSKEPNRNRSVLEGFVEWHTCMRSIYFTDARLVDVSLLRNQNLLGVGYEMYKGYQAYSFLLEIVSGMDSKLFGESEVQAQFNDRFSSKNLPMGTLRDFLLRLKSQIIEHVRLVRSEFIAGKGRLTYGGIADSLLPKEIFVAILGTGQLTESMLIHLQKKGRTVQVVGRNIQRLQYLHSTFGIETCLWEDFDPKNKSILIAAPISFETYITKMSPKSIILDFRGEFECEGDLSKVHYIPFSSILKQIEKTKEKEISLKTKVLHRIKELSWERENESVHLPHGWEDLGCLT